MPAKMPPEVARRLFHRVFICMKCKARIRADMEKVLAGKVKCRRCGSKKLRMIAKERRGIKK